MLTAPFGGIIKSQGMTKLQECCDRITSYTTTCNLCGQNTKKIQHKFQNVIIIDVEYIFIEAMNQKKKIADVSRTPKSVYLHSQKYDIMGLVEFTRNHYIAHSYINGSWIVKDDLLTRIYLICGLTDPG